MNGKKKIAPQLTDDEVFKFCKITAEGIQLDEVEDGRSHKIQEAVTGDSLNNTVKGGG